MDKVIDHHGRRRGIGAETAKLAAKRGYGGMRELSEGRKGS